MRATKLDGCLTDPEPGMDSGQATVRNVRSKCRCSCVLQFTFRRAVSCVLHRPSSQVIHCTVLSFRHSPLVKVASVEKTTVFHIPTQGKGSVQTRAEAKRSLGGWISPLSVTGAPHLAPRPPAGRETSTVRSAHSRCSDRPQTGGQPFQVRRKRQNPRFV